MLRTMSTPVLFLALAARAVGLGSDYPVGPPVRLDQAPTGLTKLINQESRVHGFFVNAEDRFFFMGNTSAFASFLKQYSALTGIAGHRLIVHPGTGVAKSPWDDAGDPCDWMLEVALASWREGHAEKVFRDPDGLPPKAGDREYVVELHVWTQGQTDVKKITVPKGVHVVHERESERQEAPGK